MDILSPRAQEVCADSKVFWVEVVKGNYKHSEGGVYVLWGNRYTVEVVLFPF